MRFWKILGFASVIAAQSVAAEQPAPLPLDNPAYSQPAKPWTSVEDAAQTDASYQVQEGVSRLSPQEQRVCRDTLSTAQEETDDSVELPLVKPERMSPDDPHLIYAVDHRQDGCSMMVMKSTPGDIKPLPDKPAQLQLRHRAAESDQ